MPESRVRCLKCSTVYHATCIAAHVCAAAPVTQTDAPDYKALCELAARVLLQHMNDEDYEMSLAGLYANLTEHTLAQHAPVVESQPQKVRLDHTEECFAQHQDGELDCICGAVQEQRVESQPLNEEAWATKLAEQLREKAWLNLSDPSEIGCVIAILLESRASVPASKEPRMTGDALNLFHRLEAIDASWPEVSAVDRHHQKVDAIKEALASKPEGEEKS